MKTLTTLLLTLGLCGLSLPALAGPSCDANADENLNVLDVVAIVGAVLGTSGDVTCAGPGCDAAVADATSGMFTQAELDAAVAEALVGMVTEDVADAAVAAAVAAAMPDCAFEGGEVWDGSACVTPETPAASGSCTDLAAWLNLAVGDYLSCGGCFNLVTLFHQECAD